MVSMANDDKDLSSIDALPDPDAKPTPAAQGDALATAIQATATGIGTDSGKAPEQVAADAAAAATATRNLANSAVTVADAVRILKAAAAAWRKNAPKKADFDAAEKELADARQQMSDAASASGDTSAASKRVEDALAHLRKITADRKAADDAFDKEWKRAVAKLAALNKTGHDGDSPITPAAPGAGAGSGIQSTGAGAGTPAAKPDSGTPKPTGTPAATPPSSTPTSTNGKSSDTDLNTALAAAALAGQGQNQQPQQAAATTPQAMPAATQPQQQNQGAKDKGDPAKTLLEEATRNGEQALGLAGITNPATTVTGAGSPQSPTPAPVANTNGTTTTFRPANAAIPGTLPGGTPAPQPAPVVSGRSFDNLNTQSDVGGRPPGTENKPFAPTPGGAETKTSGAHGAGNTAQSQAAAQQQAQRGTGMPMMPAVPMSGTPGAGPGHRDPDKTLPTTYRGANGYHGEDSLAESTPYTIAQNRPDRDKPAA